MKDKQVFIEDRMDSMLIHPSIDGHRHLAKCLIPEIKDRKS